MINNWRNPKIQGIADNKQIILYLLFNVDKLRILLEYTLSQFTGKDKK